MRYLSSLPPHQHLLVWGCIFSGKCSNLIYEQNSRGGKLDIYLIVCYINSLKVLVRELFFWLMLSTLLYLMIVLSNPTSLAVLGASAMPLATHSFSLNNRYGNDYVNGVFKDNILLTLKYLDGSVKAADEISWENIEKPFRYEFTLQPGQIFAFHDKLLPQYAGKVVKTTNAHFNYADGFKSDGFLTGDGVCHLASLIYWVARDAGLDAYSPANHNFAPIPEVPKEFGVSIYAMPGDIAGSAHQNLYITNNKDMPVRFVFDNKDNILTVSVFEAKTN